MPHSSQTFLTEEALRAEIERYALPPGQPYYVAHSAAPGNATYPLHHHEEYEVFYVVSGRLIYAIEGRRYTLEPGCMLIIPPYRLHQPCTYSGQPYERIVFSFSAALPQTLSEPGCDLTECLRRAVEDHCEFLRLDEDCSSAWTALTAELYREQLRTDFGTQLQRKTLLTQLFILLNRIAQGGSQLHAPIDTTEAWVAQVADYIDTHYAEHITTKTLEAQFYRSRYQITREFTRIVGCAPHRYLLQKRLLNAQQLLRRGVAPQQAAAQCGFRDYTSFYRNFCSTYGTAPRAYQRSVAADLTDS